MVAETAVVCVFTNNYYDTNNVFFVRNMPLHRPDDKLHQGVSFFQKNIKLFLADGTQGLPDFAPFDGILVTAGAPEMPEPYLMQVLKGGSIIIPIGTAKKQKINRFTRVDTNEFVREQLEDCSFVPLLGENGWGKTK